MTVDDKRTGDDEEPLEEAYTAHTDDDVAREERELEREKEWTERERRAERERGDVFQEDE